MRVTGVSLVAGWAGVLPRASGGLAPCFRRVEIEAESEGNVLAKFLSSSRRKVGWVAEARVRSRLVAWKNGGGAGGAAPVGFFFKAGGRGGVGRLQTFKARLVRGLFHA